MASLSPQETDPMMLNRRGALGLAALAATPAPALAMTPVSQTVAPPDPVETIRLWPNGAPGGANVTVTAQVVERSTDPAFHDRFAQYTTDPILTVLRPERPNGASLLLIPGGGYRWAVVDKEGLECARPFAAAGVTCSSCATACPPTAGPPGPPPRCRTPSAPCGWSANRRLRPGWILRGSPCWAPPPAAIWPER